jgi:hypothetical protein
VSDNENRYREMVVRAAEERRMQIVSRSRSFASGMHSTILLQMKRSISISTSSRDSSWIGSSGLPMTLTSLSSGIILPGFFYKHFEMNDASLDQGGLVGRDVVSPSEASMYGFDMGFRFKTAGTL